MRHYPQHTDSHPCNRPPSWGARGNMGFPYKPHLGEGSNTLYTPYTLYITLTRDKVKLGAPKGKTVKGRHPLLDSDSTRQPDRAHARTQERNEAKQLSDWTHPQPPIYMFCFASCHMSIPICVCLESTQADECVSTNTALAITQ